MKKRIPFGPVVKVFSEVLALLWKQPNNFKRRVCFIERSHRSFDMVPYVPVLLTSSQGEPAEVRKAPPWEKDMRKGPDPRPQQGFNQSLKLNSVFAKRGSSRAQENLP